MDSERIAHEEFPEDKILISVKATLMKYWGVRRTEGKRRYPVWFRGMITRIWGTMTITDKHIVFAAGNKTLKFAYAIFAFLILFIAASLYFLSYSGPSGALNTLMILLPAFVTLLLLVHFSIKNFVRAWERSAVKSIEEKSRVIELSSDIYPMKTGHFMLAYRPAEGSMWFRIDEHFDGLKEILNSH